MSCQQLSGRGPSRQHNFPLRTHLGLSRNRASFSFHVIICLATETRFRHLCNPFYVHMNETQKASPPFSVDRDPWSVQKDGTTRRFRQPVSPNPLRSRDLPSINHCQHPHLGSPSALPSGSRTRLTQAMGERNDPPMTEIAIEHPTIRRRSISRPGSRRSARWRTGNTRARRCYPCPKAIKSNPSPPWWYPR